MIKNLIKYFIMQPNKISNKNEILDILKGYNINYNLIEHEMVMTIEDMKKHIKFDKSDIYKNLFYKDKKDNCYLIIAHHLTEIKRDFWKEIGVNYNHIRMAKEDILKNVLNVKVGCVNPFALLNDTDKKVKLIIDKNMETHEYFAFHPLENTSSIEISQKDFFDFLEKNSINHKYLDLSQVKVNNDKPKDKNKKQDKKQPNTNEELNKLKLEVTKTDNFAKWYTEVIKKSDMIEYYDVSGCYILRPNSYYIWEVLQRFLDLEFKTLKVKNVYFPMFVTASKLEKEKDHLEGFSAEVAWVTRSGKTDLNEPIAIRPTSETIMYPAYSKWIRSHRDLPLLLNQWSNIVRWEFKNPTPFIRTREFLWQEGHTAHESREDASNFAYKILDKYEKTYKEVLCIPVIKGVKSELEKFAGADFTTTCETFIPENGRAIQACTSHMLGQNFSKMFDIKYENKDQKKLFCWQTSWGYTTRSIGVLTMIHGDDKGLVLPPKVANNQVVIVPINIKNKNIEEIKNLTEKLEHELNERSIRTILDDRTVYTSGYKFNDWELKGVPLRIEVGPNDIVNKKLKMVKRYNNEKFFVEFNNNYDNLAEQINDIFINIEESMYKNAETKILNLITVASNWKEFMINLNNRKILKTLWCDNKDCEEEIKKESADESESNEEGLSGSAKTLCKPIDQEVIKEDDKCFKCAKTAKTWVLWGRSY